MRNIALKSGDKTYSEKLVSYVLSEAGLLSNQIDKLQSIPWPEYMDIANRAPAKLAKDLGPSNDGMSRGFSPVVDGVYLPQHPYSPEASSLAGEILSEPQLWN